MSAFGVVVGVVGMLAAVGAFVWYKLHAFPVDASQLASEQARQSAVKLETLQTQLSAKNEQERAELGTEVKNVLAMEDKDAKQKAALELLARIRGVD